MNKYVVVLLSAVFMVIRGGISDSAAATVDVALLQNATCVRTTAAPSTCTFTFPGVLGEGVLHVTNGDAAGGHRVSAAVIRLNGVLVVGPEAFGQQVGTVTQPLTIGATNTLTVEMRGAPGGRLALQVVAHVTADAAAVIGPLGGAVLVADPGSPISGVTVTIPPGALSEDRVVTVTRHEGLELFDSAITELTVLPAFSVECQGKLSLPATITYPIPDSDGDGLLDGTLVPLDDINLVTWSDGGPWARRNPARYDAGLNALVTLTDHFSVWQPYSQRWVAGTVYYAVHSLPSSPASLLSEVDSAFKLWAGALSGAGLTFVRVNPDDSRVNIMVSARDFCAPLSYHACEAYADALLSTMGGGGTTYYWDVVLNTNQTPDPAREPRVWLGPPYTPWPPSAYEGKNVAIPALRVMTHEVSHALGIDYDGAPCNYHGDPPYHMSSRDCSYEPKPLTTLSATDIDRIRGHYGLAKAIVVDYTDSAGRKWADLTTTPTVSWNDLSAVCSRDGSTPCRGSVGGVDLTGWVWATLDQVRELFYESGVPAGSLDGYGAFHVEQNATWAPLFLRWFTPNYVESTSAAVFGWSATKDIYDRGAHAPFIINYFSSTGWDTADLQDIEETSGSAPILGVWLFRR